MLLDGMKAVSVQTILSAERLVALLNLFGQTDSKKRKGEETWARLEGVEQIKRPGVENEEKSEVLQFKVRVILAHYGLVDVDPQIREAYSSLTTILGLSSLVVP